MAKRTEIHAVEFFRKVRDDQAAALQGKTYREIIAFFSEAARKAARHTRAQHGHERKQRAG
jgi:hypothetical protein